MKKIFLFLGAALFSLSSYAQSPSSNAQSHTFSKSDLVFNLGIGFGTSLYSGSYYKSTLPPISISGEYGVKDDFLITDMTLGLGGYVGFAGSKYEVTSPYFGTYGYKFSYTVIGVRGALHYPVVDKLDTYGGIMVGYNIVSIKEIGDVPSIGYSASGSEASFSIYVGGRYYFSEKFAAMAEIGYGIAYLNIGVALKL